MRPGYQWVLAIFLICAGAIASGLWQLVSSGNVDVAATDVVFGGLYLALGVAIIYYRLRPQRREMLARRASRLEARFPHVWLMGTTAALLAARLFGNFVHPLPTLVFWLLPLPLVVKLLQAWLRAK